MNNETTKKLLRFYEAMLNHFGPQHWWPGDTAFEVMVGAVLTQNTNWSNVEKALANLKTAKRLDATAIDQLSHADLAEYIRPAGYFNVKARRLKNLISWFCREHDGSIERLADWPLDRLREQLLSIKGIGPETADSILLYALEKPTFVVDTYTYRILVRHGCLDRDCDYEQMKDFFERHLDEDTRLYNEFHALIVQVGKHHCKPQAKCEGCPLAPFDHQIENDY